MSDLWVSGKLLHVLPIRKLMNVSLKADFILISPSYMFQLRLYVRFIVCKIVCDGGVVFIFIENLSDVQALDETEIFIQDAIEELNWLKNHLEDENV